MPAKIRKGDTVEVLAGKNKGSRGAVLQQSGRGGIIEKEAPIHVSKVALVHHGERTRVGFRSVDGDLVRWSKKHDEAIDG
jgi:large subunit ribosomal protein L24